MEEGEWIPLRDTESIIEEFVLGCDFNGDYFRMHVCEGKIKRDDFNCKKTKGKFLKVQDTICPSIGFGQTAYWMPLPKKDNKRWIKFDVDNRPKFEEEMHEVLILLYNGKYYTGFIESRGWCPTHNMSKSWSLDEIDFYMDLPKRPLFINP